MKHFVLRLLRIVKFLPLSLLKCFELSMHSLLYSYNTLKDETGDMAELLVAGHVLEKGITMPNRRLGFGYESVRGVIRRCKKYLYLYGADHVEIQAALADLEQYGNIHKQNQYELPIDIENGIKEVLKSRKGSVRLCSRINYVNFFEKTDNFEEFAHQRHSVRWFSGQELKDENIIKSINIAQTAPSACNRQSTKVYVIKDAEKKKEILNLQNGNRGFGHLADRIVLITTDMRAWSCKFPTSPFVDAGIFTMNLLYAFHYEKIGACTLNAHLSYWGRKKLRKIIGYPKYEFPVVFIVIGNVPDEFMVAGSQRVNLSDIYRML